MIHILFFPALQMNPDTSRLINVFAVLIFMFFIALCLLALIALLAALLPNVANRSQAALQHSPWRAFFIGLVNYLFLGGISLLLFSTEVEILGLLGLIILVFLISLTAIGLPGLAMLVGQQLSQLNHSQASPLKALLGGAITLEIAAMLPIVGWFILNPILLMLAFGTTVLAWRNRKAADDFATADWK